MIIGTNHLGRALATCLGSQRYDRAFIFIEHRVAELHSSLYEELEALLPDALIRLVNGSEECKDPSHLAELWTLLSEGGATRQSILIPIGGGALLDLAGLSASTYMRGIRTIYVPTTLLAMVDASVGGKTAIDFLGVKNLIGSFHPATEVIIDTQFLATLPLEELLSGYGEVIKHATLQGQEAWLRLLRLGDPLALSDDEWLQLITESVEYKASIVAADPQEAGLRRILNIGHTIGHALEAYSRSRPQLRPLPHGEAVVFGLIIETYISFLQCGDGKEYIRQLLSWAKELYSPPFYLCKDYPEIIRLMRSDKKNQGSSITLMAVHSPGNIQPLAIQDEDVIKEGLDFLRETFGR